ncbi:serine hydrolase domain-containing protein [Brevundimonas sp.]|uniref:serine hydrolase domain-containing protein n=1 Tax=Brevundimonas sp. TaxID=1871086 RepID=UPI002D3F329F|nr:serine hydrolase domain-containing protein [Brevundimonas sp.]HYC97467.1 serine hydrolase domain-containing protein [Brevundimonas sp.]
MRRRDVMLGAGAAIGWSLTGPAQARPQTVARVPAAWLDRWLAAFNDPDLHVYQRFIQANAPAVIPYLDDDLAVREATGGFELLTSELTAPGEITAVVRDRAWDRRSKVVLQASTPERLDDISFGAAPAGDPVPRLDETDALRLAAETFEREGRAGRLSGAVFAARGGAALLRAAYGLADEETRTANTPETRFCIGSMGKMFTAVAIMQAVDEGVIGLEAPLRAYLPDYPNAAIADAVTIRQLLTHTGGTGDVFGPEYDGHEGSDARPAHLIDLYGHRDPMFEPGSRWGYSNYGFVLLGRVLEVVRGRPYAEVVDRQVFGPAGMTATSLSFAHARSTATGYTGARPTGLKALRPYAGLPAGGGYSTVDDLNAFVTALRNGALLRDGTLARMTEPLVVAGSSHWGLGFAIRTRNGQRYFGHGGSAPGISAELAVFPLYATIILCNRGHPAAVCAADYVGSRLPD